MPDAQLAHLPDALFRAAHAQITPYEPGKPADEVQRELGLERVVKLASNEGPFPPLPAAVEALARGLLELNRYPDGGQFRLRSALAERHGVKVEEVVVSAGADGVIAYLCLVALDPGDEIVCGWPSFPSYVLGALKQGAHARRVALTPDLRYDLAGLLDAITPRTKLVFVPNPNNPTGTMVTRSELLAFVERLPGHVLAVLDEAYHEYVDEPEYPDGIEEVVKAGAPAIVLRTFSKIYGLAGLRVGYGVGPAGVVEAIRKVQNAFDVTQPAQDAALASLEDPDELARRRRLTAEWRGELVAGIEALGLAVARPVANFVYVETGAPDARPLFEALLEEGVIVRPLGGFGAPGAIRVSVGTAEENAAFLDALPRALARVRTHDH